MARRSLKATPDRRKGHALPGLFTHRLATYGTTPAAQFRGLFCFHRRPGTFRPCVQHNRLNYKAPPREVFCAA